MRYRPIDTPLAQAIYDILASDCGAPEQWRQDFVDNVTDDTHPCIEYRFQGALGFGGKYRNNGNNDNTPYVDCHPEDLTPARRRMMAHVNRNLAALFKDAD